MSLHVHKYFELFLSNMTISVTLIFQNTLHNVMITVEYINREIALLPHKHVTPDMYV